MRIGRLGTLVVGAGLVVGACGGGGATPAPSAASSAPPSSAPASADSAGDLGGPLGAGDTLCRLLGPGDFTAQGLTGTATPQSTDNTATEAYCVYKGTSSATGGIEFDAFVADDAAGAQDTYTTIIGEGGSGGQAASLPGVDQSLIDLNAEGTFATVAVRAGKLSFDIGIPKGDRAQAQLLALAALVLERSTALR